MLIGDKKSFIKESGSTGSLENEEVVDLFSNEPISSGETEVQPLIDEEPVDEREAPSSWWSMLQKGFGLEGQRKKHSYRWVLSVVGECLLIIPVIIVLIVIGQFFHFM